jgi:hypothetical protein
VSTPGNNRMIAISAVRHAPALMLTSAHAPHRGVKDDLIRIFSGLPSRLASLTGSDRVGRMIRAGLPELPLGRIVSVRMEQCHAAGRYLRLRCDSHPGWKRLLVSRKPRWGRAAGPDRTSAASHQGSAARVARGREQPADVSRGEQQPESVPSRAQSRGRAGGPPTLEVGPSCEAAGRGSVVLGRDKKACLADETTAQDTLKQTGPNTPRPTRPNASVW